MEPKYLIREHKILNFTADSTSISANCSNTNRIESMTSLRCLTLARASLICRFRNHEFLTILPPFDLLSANRSWRFFIIKKTDVFYVRYLTISIFIPNEPNEDCAQIKTNQQYRC